MIANTPSTKIDLKDLFEKNKPDILKECKKITTALWNNAWETGNDKLIKKYTEINYDKVILNAVEEAIKQAVANNTSTISSLSIAGIEVTIDYRLTADKEEQEEVLTGTSSTPSSYFSRSPTPKGMFRTLSGIGSCFGGSQRSSTSTSPADFNLNGSPSPKP